MPPMPSTLRRRTVIYLGLMGGISLLMGLAAVIGVNGVHDDLSIALQGNQQLRQVYEVGLNVSMARRALNSAHPDQAAAMAAMQIALATLEASDYSGTAAPEHWLDDSKKTQCLSRLRETIEQLKRPTGEGTDALAAARETQRSAINIVLGQLATLSSDVRQTITTKQHAAEQKRERTMYSITALCLLAVIGAVAIGLRQYRSVMRPLDRISLAVRNFTSGQLTQRIEPTGDREFVELATAFNLMAAELEGLYRQLEEKVAAKSRELVRSERLASVGYLAAGVAHEMNNPLGIIAGYGERSLQHLSRGLDDTTLSSAQRAIKIMCDEAFRCKEITQRLLALARPGSGHRRPLPIATVIQEVISNLGGLPEFADRRITLESRAKADLLVLGNDGELRQVMLNLMLNALQATGGEFGGGTGEVRISVAENGPNIEIRVRDNGSGMSAETLAQVFEPFFTDKRGRQRPGTGLGLSITHAIVLDHGGRIFAQSDGPGRGSQFTVCLPAASSSSAALLATAEGAELAKFA